jgi:Uma2 family endonuclease
VTLLPQSLGESRRYNADEQHRFFIGHGPMTLAHNQLTFADYLLLDDGTDNRYELIDGELTALPPESEFNSSTANYLFLQLVMAGIPFRLIHPHVCEVQVPVLTEGDAANRFPDLVVLREEHLELTQKRLTVTLEMPPPQLIVEVVSPGKANRQRDYDRKRAQYKAIGVPEYWIIDRPENAITVLILAQAGYVELGQFRDEQLIQSRFLPDLEIAAQQILNLS